MIFRHWKIDSRIAFVLYCRFIDSGNMASNMDFPDQNCFGCELPIREKDFKLFNTRAWHKDCFKCAKCLDTLEDIETVTFAQNTIFCTAHVEAGEIGTNLVCPTCNDKFHPFDKNCVNANGLAFHPKCFKCSQCNDVMPVAKEAWTVHENKLYCTKCHTKDVVLKCIKCEGPVSSDPNEQLVTQAGMWCQNCSKCQGCSRQLNDKTCKINEVVGLRQLFCDRCTADYQRAVYGYKNYYQMGHPTRE